jgi:hypothetical protein
MDQEIPSSKGKGLGARNEQHRIFLHLRKAVSFSKLDPGPNPTKHDFSNFTNIFSQICVNFVHICEKLILPNFCKYWQA